MIYAPHTLQVLRKTETRDKLNRVVSVTEDWVEVGVCRCDDNSDRIISAENSLEYVPKYHIVTPRTTLVRNGDKIRVYDSGNLRAEGKADAVKVLNFLDYTSFYAG